MNMQMNVWYGIPSSHCPEWMVARRQSKLPPQSQICSKRGSWRLHKRLAKFRSPSPQITCAAYRTARVPQYPRAATKRSHSPPPSSSASSKNQRQLWSDSWTWTRPYSSVGLDSSFQLRSRQPQALCRGAIFFRSLKHYRLCFAKIPSSKSLLFSWQKTTTCTWNVQKQGFHEKELVSFDNLTSGGKCLQQRYGGWDQLASGNYWKVKFPYQWTFPPPDSVTL